MNWPTPRKSVRIARVEYLRSVRAVAKNPMQLLGMGVFVLVFVGGATVGGSYAVYRFGDRIAELPFLLDGARGATAVASLGIVVMLAARAVGKTARIDHETGILTTVPARDVVGGLLLAEFARVSSVAAVPLLALSATWAVVLGSPVPFVAIVSAAAALLVLALLVGHLLGVLFKMAFARSKLLARYKTLVFAAIFVAYFAAIMSNALGSAMVELGRHLQDAPTAWFGDVLVAGFPAAEPSPLRMLGALALFLVAVPVLLLLDVRAATRLWYGDAVKPGSGKRPKTDRSKERADDGFLSGDGPLAGVASRPTRSVTANVWRRTKRAPIRLIYAVYPVFFFTGFLQEVVSSGEIPSGFPVIVALYGAWVVGATALNPLGDEGAMLPVTLTSTLRGEQFVRGHVLAATLVTLPLVVVATAVSGALSPLEPDVWLALTAASALLGVAGAVVAVGVGTVFPRFGEVRVTRSRRVVVPSKTAFVVYTVALLAGFVGAAVAAVPEGASLVSNAITFWSTLLWRPVEIPTMALRVVGGAVAVLLGVVTPPVAYRYAARRFESYVLG
ncbi:hypothetical protein [Haladaptatus salinisoli]|uniref:hypothetical protein n=1 Tax=Haladaptatus salinisoli TaxID=2884876 RepID=UPI001D0A03B1|nr:hypothetical protein [Haladaptatus salinisoli]